MKTEFARPLGLTALLLSTLSSAALAQGLTSSDAPVQTQMAPITVLLPQSVAGAGGVVFTPSTIMAAPAADGGSLLANVPGISVNRMGGHGLDIIIRGQQANQINVIDEGAVTYGGCPNRMDPPTSSLSLARADRIVVERGYASVTNGPGGTGGTVKVERDAPVFAEGARLSGAVNAGYIGNGNGRTLGGTLAYDLGAGFYVEGGVEYRDSDSYEDGNGREERSAYTQKNAGLTFGYERDGLDLALDVERNRSEDVLFAGAGMDSPLSENRLYRLRGGMDLNAGALKRIEGVLYLSEVDHVMDNYSLRPNMAMLMRVPTTSDTVGGRLQAQLEFGATTARVGIDHQSNRRNAIAYGGMPGMEAMIEAGMAPTARFNMWPDVTIEQTGLYAETETALSDTMTLKLGARHDEVRATADNHAGLPGTTVPAPDMLYGATYGTNFATARTESNTGGLARLEYQLSDSMMVFAGLSRSVRTADSNERAMARMDWVGNPDIAPEKHTQFDLGVEAIGDQWSFNAAAYVDRVDDYILRDQFTVAGVTTYRNVSARLSGLELGGHYEMGDWLFTGDLTYTRGHNRTDGRALAQIPALEGSIAAAYTMDAWTLGGRVDFADRQDRIDPARDAGVTPGHATLDLFGSYAVSDAGKIRFGVDNAFDKAYSNHLSRGNAFDTSVTRVMEPGRSVYITYETTF